MSKSDPTKPRRIALIASKGTLDMAYPPLILANVAASMGWEAGIFFTFYGLDLIHKDRQQHLGVAPLANPAMPSPIPGSSLKIPNIIGVLPGMTAMATSMMKDWMHDARLAPLDEMFAIAKESGVRLFACNTTMRVMKIDAKDLMDGVEFAGSPTFLDYAADADIQLFI
jgi:peroxiredoxin family protein